VVETGNKNKYKLINKKSRAITPKYSAHRITFFFERWENLHTPPRPDELQRNTRTLPGPGSREPWLRWGEDAPQPVLRGVPDSTTGATTKDSPRRRLPTKNPPLRPKPTTRKPRWGRPRDCYAHYFGASPSLMDCQVPRPARVILT